MYTPDELSELDDRDYRDAYVDEHVRTTVAYQIRSIRERLTLTQKQFAKILETSPSVISRFENAEYGNVTINTLLNISKKLDIALVVKFSTFPEFLDAYSDLSPEYLAVDDYETSKHGVDNMGVGLTGLPTSGVEIHSEVLPNENVHLVFGSTVLYPTAAIGTSAFWAATGFALTRFEIFHAKTAAGEKLNG